VEFDATGEARAATNTRVNLGFVEMTLGNYERAEELLRQALATTERLGLASVRAYALHNLGHIRAELGDPEGAISLQREAIAVAKSHGEGILEGSARAYLALAACRANRLDVAEAEARRASQILAKIPALHPLALASLSRVLLAAGNAESALDEAERAWRTSREHGTPEDTESLVLLVLAKAQLATGRQNEARSTLKIAAESLSRRADRLGDEELSRTLLERVSDNAELLALAREHGA
jgi:tetratricopeptide (TPR) repeat protein